MCIRDRCRKHLLSLPVSIDEKRVSLNECERRQLEDLNHHLNKRLDIFLFISPLKLQLNYGAYQDAYPQAAIALSRSEKLDRKGQFFNGNIHFLLLCCGPITLIIQFDHSLSFLKNKGFHLTSDPVGAGSDVR